MNNFVKFPSTPHMIWPETGDIRTDKLMPIEEIEEMLQHELVVEEKVDGANLGISFDSEGRLQLQNRGNLLEFPLMGQWTPLETWVSGRQDRLFDILLDQYILFGEWCVAVHSIYYNKLPDYFIGFDLYDKKESQFLSVIRRNEMLNDMNICAVYQCAKGLFHLNELCSLLSNSHYGNTMSEGIYVRWDSGEWLKKRAKLVRYDFRQQICEHWSRKKIMKNQIIGKSF